MDKECKKHSNDHSAYALTPAEKAARKREAEKAKKRAENNSSQFKEAIAKIKYPLSEKQLDALLDFAFYCRGISCQQPAVKLLGIEVVRVDQTDWNGKKTGLQVVDHRASLRKYATDGGNDTKLRTIFALLMPQPNNHEYDDGKDFKDAAKKL